jgi:hypothetical protein
MAPRNQTVRSIATVNPSQAAHEQLMLELAALRAKCEIRASLSQSVNYIQSLYSELKQIEAK